MKRSVLPRIVLDSHNSIVDGHTPLSTLDGPLTIISIEQDEDTAEIGVFVKDTDGRECVWSKLPEVKSAR